jgi:hypothetical protein
MNDCGIFMGPGEEELYREITTEFLKILRDNHLFLKPSKCTFEAKEINFLGLHLTAHGITINPSKITTIKDWPCIPKNIKKLRSVLGVLGYQCPFILNFAALTKPLTSLLKKDNNFIWTPKCHQALDTLIDTVCTSPVLVAPDQDCQFELEVDASQYALGAILWQWDPTLDKKLCAIGYYLATLSLAEQNYMIHNCELLAVMRGLHHWLHLL